MAKFKQIKVVERYSTFNPQDIYEYTERKVDVYINPEHVVAVYEDDEGYPRITLNDSPSANLFFDGTLSELMTILNS